MSGPVLFVTCLCLGAEPDVDISIRVHLCARERTVNAGQLLVGGELSLDQSRGRTWFEYRFLFPALDGASHTSFDELRDRTRLETACHLLENSEASITGIADLLGYAHSSALSLVFRRWTKLSPREWRVRMARAGRQ